MIKSIYKKVFTILFLAGLFFISGCTKIIDRENGYLEGVITIGPICPVEKDPPDPGCLPTAETYKAYPVSVYTLNGQRKIAQLNPALDGSYNLKLHPGTYLVVLDKQYYGPGGSNLPVEITIIQQDTTTLDIDIDTGIR
jgi:hypothetical protein